MEWTKKCKEACLDLKETQLLAMNTDNSNMSIGAVLFQNIDDVEIVYASHVQGWAQVLRDHKKSF